MFELLVYFVSMGELDSMSGLFLFRFWSQIKLFHLLNSKNHCTRAAERVREGSPFGHGSSEEDKGLGEDVFSLQVGNKLIA